MNRLAKALHWENAKSAARSEIVISRQCDLVVTVLRRLNCCKNLQVFLPPAQKVWKHI